VLGGDLRQILPVVEGGSRAEIVNATIVNSPLWKIVSLVFEHKHEAPLSRLDRRGTARNF
jgi:hypothetical protein